MKTHQRSANVGSQHPHRRTMPAASLSPIPLPGHGHRVGTSPPCRPYVRNEHGHQSMAAITPCKTRPRRGQEARRASLCETPCKQPRRGAPHGAMTHPPIVPRRGTQAHPMQGKTSERSSRTWLRAIVWYHRAIPPASISLCISLPTMTLRYRCVLSWVIKVRCLRHLRRCGREPPRARSHSRYMPVYGTL